MGENEDLFSPPTSEEIQQREKDYPKVSLDNIQKCLTIIHDKLGANVSLVDDELNEINKWLEGLRKRIVP